MARLLVAETLLPSGSTGSLLPAADPLDIRSHDHSVGNNLP